jgi:hypothetical protein
MNQSQLLLGNHPRLLRKVNMRKSTLRRIMIARDDLAGPEKE